jgi:multiple sugar transport system ATP-binding protein
LGFRPETFLPTGIEPGTDNLIFPFRVHRVEYLGAERLVYGAIEGHWPKANVISRIPTNIRVKIEAGRLLDFSVRRQDIERFDRANSRRVADGSS